ncbi:hypothetical protein HD841_001049 [Sphingomonas melonis]|uniref:Uncharacterized protein n=1 Tax=Sphingomonas melonis TaxID=152682 RepID=A0A7Y9FL53_9SPHN|nr:hypothetical protein [Sphingomonas melonis]
MGSTFKLWNSSPARGRWHAEGMTEGADTLPTTSLTSPSVTPFGRATSPWRGRKLFKA